MFQAHNTVMRILIIEDNSIIAQTLRHNLKTHYSIDIAKTGRKGLAAAQSTIYDTIILDLRLPDIQGEEICRQLRKKGIKTPIIILSGKGDVKGKVELLNTGADDYITKPFNFYELRARIDVAIRRASKSGSSGVIEVAGIRLDPASRTVEKRGKQIQLRRKEFDLLEYMMRYPDQTLTRAMILEHIWDMNENLWANVVDVHIKHLRDKIDKPFNTKLIRTVHGVGYKLNLSSHSHSENNSVKGG